MILPHDKLTLILLMLLSMACWGSWPVLYKLAKKYRFELFYFDFAFGLFLIALLFAFTFGSLGFDGFNFTDDLQYASKRQWLHGFLGAMIFNFGNMLMLASISVAGMTVAVPIAFGIALIVGSWVAFLSQPGPESTVLLAGTIFILLSLILVSAAYFQLRRLQHEILARAGKAKSTRRPNSVKGIILAAAGGVLMGACTSLLLRSQDADDGVGPYSLLFLFSGAVVLSTFIYNLFFMNLPVEGDPVEIADYFKATLKNHLVGLAGGAVWGVGALASFVAFTPKGTVHLTAPLGPFLAQAAPLVAVAWGLVYWKEFNDGDIRVRVFGAFMWFLFAAGLMAFAYAPLMKL